MLDLNDIHLQHHPVSQAFPLLVGHEFEHLVDDIRAHGLREPIWLDREGRILDGRNRDRACLLSGMPPAYRVYDGVDEVAFVISMNLHRRHLNESQRAMVAARIANLDHEGCRGDRDQDANLPLGSVSSEAAAELLNVSRRSVISARRIRDQGAPALVAAVDEGLVAVSDAAAVTGLAAADQQALVDAVRAGAHNRLAVEQLGAIERMLTEPEFVSLLYALRGLNLPPETAAWGYCRGTP